MGVLEQIIARAAIFSTKAQGEHNFATDPVGTGDYKVTKCTTGSSMTMEARSDYWGNDPAIAAKRAPYHTATVQKINFQIISESAQAAIALETNKIDVCSYITADTLPEFQEGGQYAGNYQVIEAMASDYYQINPNGGSKFGSDENLMKAIYYALDNTSIAKAMGGSYIPAKAYGSSFFYDYDKSWESESNYINTYDPAKAKEFLSKSNYKGETLQMIGLSTEAVKNAMQMIQVQLLQVGINVNINAYDQNTMEATMGSKDGWDFVVSLTGGPSLVKSLGGYGNTINADNNNKYWVSDDQLQSLLDTANTDGTNDQEHLKAALDYIMDKGYGYVIADASSSIVATKKLTKMFMREGYYTVAASTYSNN
jgi:peptide/nickel transport system substrate-binding protein